MVVVAVVVVVVVVVVKHNFFEVLEVRSVLSLLENPKENVSAKQFMLRFVQGNTDHRAACCEESECIHGQTVTFDVCRDSLVVGSGLHAASRQGGVRETSQGVGHDGGHAHTDDAVRGIASRLQHPPAPQPPALATDPGQEGQDHPRVPQPQGHPSVQVLPLQADARDRDLDL